MHEGVHQGLCSNAAKRAARARGSTTATAAVHFANLALTGPVQVTNLLTAPVAVKVWPSNDALPVGATAAAAVIVNGTSYRDGLTVHTPAQMVYRLGGHCSTFQRDISLDAAAKGGGTVDFQIWADNVMLYDSGVITGSSPTKTVRVGMNGYQTLRLVVTGAQDGIANDVADPTLVCGW